MQSTDLFIFWGSKKTSRYSARAGLLKKKQVDTRPGPGSQKKQVGTSGPGARLERPKNKSVPQPAQVAGLAGKGRYSLVKSMEIDEKTQTLKKRFSKNLINPAWVGPGKHKRAE